MTTYIGTVELGGLYRTGIAVLRPDQPWLIDLSVLKPFDELTPGNIADFSENPSWTDWVLGDTPAQESLRLRWHVLKDGDRGFLICDRVILVKVSWHDLNQAGFVNGTAVQIDVPDMKVMATPEECPLTMSGTVMSSMKTSSKGYLHLLIQTLTRP